MSYKRRWYLLVLTLAAVSSAWAVLGIAVENSKDKFGGEIRLIVRGDDIGFCHAANAAFEQAYKNGILTCAEVMVPGPWFNEAVQILKRNPGLDVGVHLTLTSEWDLYKWKPVTPASEVPSLVDKDGYFFARTDANPAYDKYYCGTYGFLQARPKLSEVEKELRAQIELALREIPNISHLSCHMGTAEATPELKALTATLAEEYKLGIVGHMGVQRSTSLWKIPPEQKEKTVAEILKNLEPGLWEIGCHPGLDTPEMRAISTRYDDPNIRMSVHRAAVTKALTSKKVKEIIRKRNIKLISYRDLKKN